MADSGVLARGLSWSSIPTESLLAELSRREDGRPKPECGSSKTGSYDTPLHIGALILILTLSTISCGFPLLPRRGAKGRPQSWIIFYCQHFGTGVLLATAFVHLLPKAFTSLTDPCLPHAFSKGYRPMAGLVAMVAALSVVALESYLSTRGAGHSHSYEFWDEDDCNDDTGAQVRRGSETSLVARRPDTRRPSDIMLDNVDASEGLMTGASPLPGSTPTIQATRGAFKDGEDSDLDLDVDELDPENQAQPLTRSRNGRHHSIPKEEFVPAATHVQTPEEQKRLLLQCLLLEAGILFHSIFIGMALSVATGPTFVVFLIAISFHQSFEGLALGSRIAAIQLPRSSIRPWLMVLAFGATTPLGQAIGLIVHNMYDPKSQTGLLMVGFMNAISSGLLLFAGLVQLLAEDFLTEKSYKTLHGKRRVKAYLAVLGGAGIMAGVAALA